MDQQLSMFGEETTEETYIMPLEEMRKHEWVVAWSGGKDSTATIIKMHELGVPIKAIVFVLMMWDDTTPAIYPVMYEFILKAKSVFESWGYNVILQKSIKTAKERAEMVFKKSNIPELIGKTYGARAFFRGGVHFNSSRKEALYL